MGAALVFRIFTKDFWCSSTASETTCDASLSGEGARALGGSPKGSPSFAAFSGAPYLTRRDYSAKLHRGLVRETGTVSDSEAVGGASAESEQADGLPLSRAERVRLVRWVRYVEYLYDAFRARFLFVLCKQEAAFRFLAGRLPKLFAGAIQGIPERTVLRFCELHGLEFRPARDYWVRRRDQGRAPPPPRRVVRAFEGLPPGAPVPVRGDSSSEDGSEYDGWFDARSA